MPPTFKDYYSIMGVPRTASDEDIKKAYRRLAREHHPDLHPEGEKELHTRRMQEINEAYTVLSDKDKRAKYDRYGADWEAGPPPPRGSGGKAPDTEPSYNYEAPARHSPEGDGGFSDFFRQYFGREQGSFEESEARGTRAGRDIEAEAEVTLEDAVQGGERSFRLAVSSPCPTFNGTGPERPQPCPPLRRLRPIHAQKTLQPPNPPPPPPQ